MKNSFEVSMDFFRKIQQFFFAYVGNFAKFAKFQKFQLDNLVDFEKCCKTRIFLQKSVPIQPKTSNILPKFCHKLTTTLRVRPGAAQPRDQEGGTRAGRHHGDPGDGTARSFRVPARRDQARQSGRRRLS